MLSVHTICCIAVLTLFQPGLATETLDFELKPAGIEQSVEHEAVSKMN